MNAQYARPVLTASVSKRLHLLRPVFFTPKRRGAILMETALPQSGHFLRKHIDSYLRVSGTGP